MFSLVVSQFETLTKRQNPAGQSSGEVINLPPVEELADNEIVLVSGLVITALDAKGEFSYSGRVVSPGKTKRAEDGSIEGVLSWTTTRCQ